MGDLPVRLSLLGCKDNSVIDWLLPCNYWSNYVYSGVTGTSLHELPVLMKSTDDDMIIKFRISFKLPDHCLILSYLILQNMPFFITRFFSGQNHFRSR